MSKRSYMQALEDQIDLLKWWGTPYGQRYGENFLMSIFTDHAEREMANDDIRKNAAEWNLGERMMKGLDTAATYVVTDDMVHLVSAASPKFPMESLVFHDDDTPTYGGFVVMEEPVMFLDRHGKRLSMDAFSWWPTLISRRGLFDKPVIVPSLQIACYRRHRARDDQHQMSMGVDLELWGWTPISLNVPVEEQLPPEATETIEEGGPFGAIVAQMRWFKAFFTLIQQKIPRQETLHDRAVRRRIERAVPTNVVPEVIVVTLRKERDDRPIEPSDNPNPQYWSHRWIVEGFWRQQWYPKAKEHRAIWIAPYVKGPADKPLVIKDRVYRWEQ